MKSVNIKLNSIDKVKNFINKVSMQEADMDLISGRYVIDAKSIMGIFSLDLSNTIQLSIHSDKAAEVDKIVDSIKEFIVEE